MKKNNWPRLHLLLFVTAGLLAATVTSAAARPPFYEELSPHGSWISWHGGINVWQPAAAARSAGWRPYYSDGRWFWNGTAWQWRSDYVWGRVVFHYGNWWEAPGLGWVWVPGTVYAPAWVRWRHHGDLWGWAPLPPPSHLQPSLGQAYRRSVDPRFHPSFSLEPRHYTFVPLREFSARNQATFSVSGTNYRVQFSFSLPVSAGPSPFSVGVRPAVPRPPPAPTTVFPRYHRGITYQPRYRSPAPPVYSPPSRPAPRPRYRSPAPPAHARPSRPAPRPRPAAPPVVAPSPSTRQPRPAAPATPTAAGRPTSAAGAARSSSGTQQAGGSPPSRRTRAVLDALRR